MPPVPPPLPPAYAMRRRTPGGSSAAFCSAGTSSSTRRPRSSSRPPSRPRSGPVRRPGRHAGPGVLRRPVASRCSDTCHAGAGGRALPGRLLHIGHYGVANVRRAAAASSGPLSCRRSPARPAPPGRPGRHPAPTWPLWSVCGVKLLRTEPVPVWAAAVDVETYRHHPPVTECALRESFDVLERCTDFRGIGLGRLPTILATGIDVEPTTAPIFVSDFDKAWEYGDWPKVIMALDGMHLDYTYREIHRRPRPMRPLCSCWNTPQESRTAGASASG